MNKKNLPMLLLKLNRMTSIHLILAVLGSLQRVERALHDELKLWHYLRIDDARTARR